MTESRSAGQADRTRLCLLLTALEGPAGEAGRAPEIALREPREEPAAVLEADGTRAAIPADQLLRQEPRDGWRLPGALCAGRPLDGKALRRAPRPYPSFRTRMSGR